MELRASAPEVALLHQRMLSAAPEEAAAFLAVEGSGTHLTLRGSQVFGRQDLDGDGLGELTLSERAQTEGLAAIKRGGHGLVEAHTHPRSDRDVSFSAFDDEQLPQFARYFGLKMPGRTFGALVLGRRGYASRVWGPRGEQSLILRTVGELAEVPTWLRPGDTPSSTAVEGHRFDRQIRALGPMGQAHLAALRVGIVGLGGTGSQVAQQVAHLGVRNLVLIDDDRVDTTNLPRLAGARALDVLLRRRKTAISRRLIRGLGTGAHVTRERGLRTRQALDALKNVDLIVGCVDNDGARLILSELAAAHVVPYLDLGVGIEAHPRELRAIGGRVAFHLPGRPCLACADELDFSEAAEDLESESLRGIRVARGYADDREVEPALMPLNTTVVGLGMIELLAFATGLRRVRPFLRYDATEQRVIPQRVELDQECPVCQPASGMGDRQDITRYALA